MSNNNHIGKEILISLLQKTLNKNLKYLEKSTEEQIETLKNTKKEFNEIENMLKKMNNEIEEIQNNLHKQKDINESEDNPRSHRETNSIVNKELKEKDKTTKIKNKENKLKNITLSPKIDDNRAPLTRSKTVGNLKKRLQTEVSKKNQKDNKLISASIILPSKKTSQLSGGKVSNFKIKNEGDKHNKNRSSTNLKKGQNNNNNKNESFISSNPMSKSIKKNINQHEEKSKTTRKKTDSTNEKKKFKDDEDIEKGEKLNTNSKNQKEKTKTQNEIEQQPESKPLEYYIKLLNKEKWGNNILNYLTEKEKFNFIFCSKILQAKSICYINTYLENIKNYNNISDKETIDDKLKEMETKYKKEELTGNYQELTLSRGSLRSIGLLNNEEYQKLYNDDMNKENQNIKDIILIHRFLFRLLNISDIYNIQNDFEFWDKCCKYLKENSEGKIGDFLNEKFKNLDFTNKNIYFLFKLIFNNKNKATPLYFSQFCNTSGLIMFLIKDAIEYSGIFISEKRTPINRIYNNLLYAKTLFDKLNKYLNYLLNDYK